MYSSSRSMFIRHNESSGGRDEPTREVDRRARARNYAVYRACRILRRSTQTIGIIRNTSDGGAEIQISGPFEIGEEITYDDAHMGTMSARIVWARGDRIGVENTATFPIVSGQHVNRRHRAIRFEVGKTAKIWMRDHHKIAHLQNISQTGACFLFERGGIDASIGALASISFDGRAFRSSMLRWHRAAQAGFKFETPFTLSELSDLLSRLTHR